MDDRELSKLMTAINEAQEMGSHSRMLRLILSNFARLPDPSLLRERVALLLAERGRKKEAVEIYQMVGRHYANAGFPMRAIAVTKQMARLNPDTTVLLEHIATLYGIRSPYIAPDARVQTFAPPTDALDLSAKEPQLSEEELMELAAERAREKRGLLQQPQELPPIPLLSLLPGDSLFRVLELLEFDIFSRAQRVLDTTRRVDELIWTVTDDLIVNDPAEKKFAPSCALLGLGAFGQSGRAPLVEVYSQSGSEILRLRTEAVEKLSQDFADFQNRLATLRRHAMTERLLQRHELFEGLSPNERVEVISAFTGMRVSEGERIIEQGKPSPGLFIVLDGNVDIVRNDGEWEITIATLRAGEVFGEIGLVVDKPAVAGCVMTKPGHLLHLPRQDFERLADQFETVRSYTSTLAHERLEDVSNTLSASDVAEIE